MKLILPKRHIVTNNNPLIFLAGPIKGAPRWQEEAAKIIERTNPTIYIASPSKHFSQEYIHHRDLDDTERFPRQLNWETYYLEKAGRENGETKGAIMFWLPAQIFSMNINLSTGFPQPYARDTRPELGRYGWGALRYNQNYPVVVGSEDNFDGIDVIKRNFLSSKPDFIFQKSLQETCEEAVRRALS